MSEWCVAPLGEIANIAIGGTPARDNQNYWDPTGQEGYPWVSIADLGPRFVTDTKERITKDGVRFSNVKPVQRDTLLLSFKLTIGRAGIAGRDLFTNEAIAAIRPIPGTVSPKFLYYVLPSIAKNSVTDTAIKGVTLNKQKLASLVVRFPKKIEIQKSIADILETVDITIEKTEALIAKYQQIKAGLMHDLFTRGVTADGKLRPPREQAPELYQETPIGWVPKEWQVVRMVDFAEDRKGSTTIGPFGSDLVATDYRLEGVPVVFVRDVKESGFEWNSETYVSEKKALKLSSHSVKAGEILASKMGLPPCVSCLYPEWMPNGVITADMIRLSPDKKKVDSYWLTTTINHDRVKRQVAAITAGVTRPKVTLADFRGIKIAKPELDEQIFVSGMLRAAQNKIDTELSKINKLQCQKHGLMHDLLTGKIAVTPRSEKQEALT